MGNIALYILLGLVAGALSGIVGVGGGIIIVPALLFFFGMSQHMAQGTTLALMVPPIGILAAWTYYNHGYVDLKVAAFVAIGFFLGGLFGAKIAVLVSNDILKKIFAFILIAVSIKMLAGK